MELLERYLQAVGKHLPVKGRNDILAELRANLLEQAEDRQNELGRPLTLEEEEALLKQHGHPLLAATRYLPQHYLIGPAVFPYYWAALKGILLLVLFAYVVANAASFIAQPVTLSRIAQIVVQFPSVALHVAFWITLIAAIVELAHTQLGKGGALIPDWSPRKLPPLEPRLRPNHQHAVLKLILGGLFLLWLLALPKVPSLMLGAAGAATLQYVRPATVWHATYWMFVCVLSLQWVFELAGLYVARLRSMRPLFSVLGKCAAAVLLWLLMRAPQLLVLTAAGQTSPQYQALVSGLNPGLRIGLRVGLIVLVLHTLWEAARLLRGRVHAQQATDVASVQRVL